MQRSRKKLGAFGEIVARLLKKILFLLVQGRGSVFDRGFPFPAAFLSEGQCLAEFERPSL